jgi:hypothetical protein
VCCEGQRHVAKIRRFIISPMVSQKVVISTTHSAPRCHFCGRRDKSLIQSTAMNQCGRPHQNSSLNIEKQCRVSRGKSHFRVTLSLPAAGVRWANGDPGYIQLSRCLLGIKAHPKGGRILQTLQYEVTYCVTSTIEAKSIRPASRWVPFPSRLVVTLASPATASG